MSPTPTQSVGLRYNVKTRPLEVVRVSFLFMIPVSKAQLRRFAFSVLVAFCTLLVSSQARADSTRERARQHVVDGDARKAKAEQAKAEGRDEEAARLFQESADEYQAAYDLVPHPLMLYNLAQVYRLAGQSERALDLYKEFLATGPTGEAAAFAQKYVKILERIIENARVRNTKDPDHVKGDDDDDDDDTVPVGDDDDDDDTVPIGDDDDDSGDGDEDPGANLRYAGVGLAAAGLVSIAIGVKFGLDAQNISDCLTNYPDSCDKPYPPGVWSDEALLLQPEGESAELKMFIFTGLGAAVFVGGGVLYYMGGKDNKPATDKSSLSLAPSFDGRSAGWSLSGRF